MKVFYCLNCSKETREDTCDHYFWCNECYDKIQIEFAEAEEKVKPKKKRKATPFPAE